MSIHLNPLDILLPGNPADERRPVDLQWGFVERVTPDVAVRLDRDPTSVIGDCDTLTAPLLVGDRVISTIFNGRTTVLGRNQGDRPAPTDNWSYDVPSTAAGWQTVASMPGNGRARGRFYIDSSTNGEHGQLVLTASAAYGQATIVVESYNAFGRSTPTVIGARYLTSSSDGTYGPGILQILTSETGTGWRVRCEQTVDTITNKAWEPMGLDTSTTGYSTTPREQVGVYLTTSVIATPGNGFTHYSASPSWQEATFSFSPGSMVTLTGLVNSSAKTANTIFTLPEGCRPAGDLIFLTQAFASSANTFARINVLDSGAVEMNFPASASYVSLSGISFPAHH